VRSFVDPGPVMASLLERAVARGVAHGYVEDLLSIFDRGERDRAAPPAQPLVEPLSEREMEVLSLVAQGLSNREVGRQLHIAESTVKSHLNSVYGKLGVANRTQAGAKARELSLF
jgi:LuxR family maltose regulon positive regulatory protein